MTDVLDIGIRVSKMNGRDEADEATRTIKQQEQGARAAIAAKGKRVGRIFKYLDQSGFTVLEKVTADVLPRVRSGESDGIVWGYGDRLARNWMELGMFFTHCIDADAEVWDATDPDLDYRTDSGRTLWGIKGVVNEIPSLDAKRKSKTLADDLVRLGIPNRSRYGYRRNKYVTEDERIVKTDAERPDKALCPDEYEAPIVRRIYAMRDDRQSWEAIARTLNEEGVPSPTGKQWVRSTLSELIASDVYLGVVRLGERVNESAHEPLVSRALWQRVQSTTTIVRNGRLVAGIGGGVLYCVSCRNTLSVIGSRTGKQRANYGCRRRSSSGACPRPVHVTKDVADRFVEGLICELLDSGDGIRVVASAREVAVARAAWLAARDARSGWADFADALQPDDFRRGYVKRERAEKAARDHYDDLRSRASDAAEWFPKDSTAWRALDEEHQRRVARQLIESVVVSAPLSRSKNAVIEDRFDVTLVGGEKMRAGRWLVAV